MNKALKWILIGLGIAAGAFIIALPIFRMVLNGGRFGIGRMGRFMPGLTFPMMGFLSIFRVIIPLGILALAVVGIVLLVRNNRAKRITPTQPAQPAAPAVVRNCVKCGKPLQEDWVNCPYCGKKQ